MQMKRKNIFWTAWAIIGLTLVVAAGVKSFANEVRDKIERSALKYLPVRSKDPCCLPASSWTASRKRKIQSEINEKLLKEFSKLVDVSPDIPKRLLSEIQLSDITVRR